MYPGFHSPLRQFGAKLQQVEGALGLFIPLKGLGLLALAMPAEGGGSASLAQLQAVAPQAGIGGAESRVAQEADPSLQPLRCLAVG